MAWLSNFRFGVTDEHKGQLPSFIKHVSPTLHPWLSTTLMYAANALEGRESTATFLRDPGHVQGRQG